MKSIYLKKGYHYIPRYNVVLNSEILNEFRTVHANDSNPITSLTIDDEFIRNRIRNLRHIIFEVTLDCNLRCKYCVYSGNYFFEKKLCKKHLDFETARSVLNNIHKISNDRYNRSLMISFYGGEPLMQMDLIKRIINYSRELFADWDLTFNMTTNGTLFNDSVIRYLVSENVILLISLDGPEPIHDSKRVYRNGMGSFTRIMNSLRRIKQIDPDYYHKRVTFNIVHSYDLSLYEVFCFFRDNDILNENRISYDLVNTEDTDYFKRYPFDHDEYLQDLNNIISEIGNKVQNDMGMDIKLSSIEETFYKNYLKNDKLGKRSDLIFSGTCLFDSRLFVDCEGKFHVCEKVNHKFSIGDVETGFDLEKMKWMLSEFEKMKNKFCVHCDVQHLCTPCYVRFSGDGQFRINRKYCNAIKRGALTNLKSMIDLKTGKSGDEKGKYKFHQFIKLEKGKVNTAIIDFLHGDVYSIPNETLEKFFNCEYEAIDEFLKIAREQNIIIKVNRDTWIPQKEINMEKLKSDDSKKKNRIKLHIEEGIDLNLLKEKLGRFEIDSIVFYGESDIAGLFPNIRVTNAELDFNKCVELSTVEEDRFIEADEAAYCKNYFCNSCWEHKVAVTKDGMIRPCIYSTIVIDHFRNLDRFETIKKIQDYWYINKDQVDTCRECELRYACFDCREIAYRESKGNLYAKNPFCKYMPSTGKWR